ncbi:MAG TPA: hypothetical protein VMM78_15170 [Thermomicrobiales bacterium]|nr:hypothetical protein [Thermomicrobiales bacterium]
MPGAMAIELSSLESVNLGSAVKRRPVVLHSQSTDFPASENRVSTDYEAVSAGAVGWFATALPDTSLKPPPAQTDADDSFE